MNIFEQLKFSGIDIGRVQSVDSMTVVPIVGRDRGDVAKPDALSFRSTTNYGTMVFENNDSQRDVIVPSNMMVRGRGAQDHAMASSGVIKAGQRQKSFNTACCIEESQGGYLGSSGNDEDILPVTLRRALLNPQLRDYNSYSKLWGKIKDWLRGLSIDGSSGRAHLRYFYDTPEVKKELEDFAAEFEPVENQIGAIIMFSGVPVGIEIMPSSEHWEAYWKHLIRGCYGAEMLRMRMLGKLKPSTLILPDIPKDASVEEAAKILEDFSDLLQKEVVPRIEAVKIKSRKKVSSAGSSQMDLIRTDSGGGGDLILQKDEPVYLSLIL